MRSDLDLEATLLADYMRGLSEEAYAADWMDGLEFELWAAVVGGPRDYGRLGISREHVDRLQQLSDAAGGSIVIDDVTEETLLSLDD